MLIKLPIIKDNVICKLNFKLNRCGNKLIISNIKNEVCNYEIFIANLDFCLTKLSIDFPFEIDILENNVLYSKFYFIIAFMHKFNCDLDFFSILLSYIKKINNNYNYADLEFIYSNFNLLTKKGFVNIEKRESFSDILDLKSYYDNVLNSSVNIIYSMIYKIAYKKINPDKHIKFEDKVNNKIKELVNYFNEIKINFNGSESKEIKEHIKNIMNYESKKLLEIPIESIIEGKNYFIEIPNDKIIKSEIIIRDKEYLQINKFIKVQIKKCKFYEYNPTLKELFTIDNLLKDIINKDNLIKQNISKIIFGRENYESNVNLYKYLFQDKKNKLLLSSISSLKYNLVNEELNSYDINSIDFELDILEKGYEDKTFMSYLSEKYADDIDSKMKILTVLFKNYNFPLTFNKKKLNTNFELIMYFSFLNIDMLIKIVDTDKIYLTNSVISCIPPKLKNLFYNLVKFYYQYQNGSLENITYNFKFYQDYIYIYIIKNIIQKTTILSELFRRNETLFSNLILVYKTNYILNQMINNLSWHDLSNKLHYLEYFYKCHDFIFFQGKLNKNLFNDTIDYKIKNIIIDKFSMYKYLKNEKDFIKWTKFIKNYISDLYEKNVIINSDDLSNLGILIYKLMNLDLQDLKDEKYNILIKFCQSHKKLILLSSRINLKIKDKLPNLKCNINLGFFAKHLNFNNHEKIEINDQNTEVDNLKDKVTVLQKKYVKYKSKYIKFKTENSSSANNMSLTNNSTTTNITTTNIDV